MTHVTHLTHLLQGNLENTDYPVIISYYTIDTVYEKEIQKLIESLEKFKLPYKIYGIFTLGSWLVNTGYKAEFVEAVLGIIDRPCVWLDADCEVLKMPSLFAQMVADKVSIAVYIRGDVKEPNLNSSTVYFGNDAFCKETVKKWAEKVKELKYDVWDQKCLEYVYLENPEKFHKIPPDYAKKAKMGKKKTSVIFQNNISTETRGGDIDNTVDYLRYICSHDDLVAGSERSNVEVKNFGKDHYETVGKEEIRKGQRCLYDFNAYIFMANYKDLGPFKDFEACYIFYIQNKRKLSLEKNPSGMSYYQALEALEALEA